MKHLGDGLMAVFSGAADAVGCASLVESGLIHEHDGRWVSAVAIDLLEAARGTADEIQMDWLAREAAELLAHPT